LEQQVESQCILTAQHLTTIDDYGIILKAR
jgi:hypothetical protein